MWPSSASSRSAKTGILLSRPGSTAREPTRPTSEGRLAAALDASGLLALCGGRRRLGRLPRLRLGRLGRTGAAADGGRHLLGRDDLERDLGLLALGRAADHDRGPRRQLGPQDEVRERVLDVALDRATQRTRPHRRVPALVDQEVLGRLGELELQLALGQRLADAAQEQLDDRLDLVLGELVEDDDLVDAVEEL